MLDVYLAFSDLCVGFAECGFVCYPFTSRQRASWLLSKNFPRSKVRRNFSVQVGDDCLKRFNYCFVKRQKNCLLCYLLVLYTLSVISTIFTKPYSSEIYFNKMTLWPYTKALYHNLVTIEQIFQNLNGYVDPNVIGRRHYEMMSPSTKLVVKYVNKLELNA